MIYGYARVSTAGQSFESQVNQLKEAGAEKIFKEKVSGTKANRPELEKLLKSLGDGDVLLVTSLDRLARSTRDLLNLLESIKEQGATFKALNQPLADTTTPAGALLIGVLGLLAEFERSLILSRTVEGKRRAMAKGKKMGRPYLLTSHQRKEIAQALRDGTATQAELARRYNVSEPTIYRIKVK